MIAVLSEAEDRSPPKHVHEKFEQYPRCGVLDHGFLRMADSARHLVEAVFGPRPVRQWVLSVPYPLRFLFASKPDAIGPVLGIVQRVIGLGSLTDLRE